MRPILRSGTEDRAEHDGELPGAVADEEREPVGALAEGHEEVAGRLCGPGSVGVGRGAQHVDVAAPHFDHEEHIYTLDGERAVDVEKVAGQYRPRLGAPELPPTWSGN